MTLISPTLLAELTLGSEDTRAACLGKTYRQPPFFLFRDFYRVGVVSRPFVDLCCSVIELFEVFCFVQAHLSRVRLPLRCKFAQSMQVLYRNRQREINGRTTHYFYAQAIQFQDALEMDKQHFYLLTFWRQR